MADRVLLQGAKILVSLEVGIGDLHNGSATEARHIWSLRWPALPGTTVSLLHCG